jgi:glutamate racemase
VSFFTASLDKMIRSVTSIFFLWILVGSFSNSRGQGNVDLSKLFAKDEVTIVITDSGLGGLSVMDDISKKMMAEHCFRKVNLIFINALFDANSGYNSLKTRDEKIAKFNEVLTSSGKRYHPDAILIACNTLSVLYKETDFVKNSKIPVLGIVDPGVKLIKEKLGQDPSSSVIIFGTETTIEENSHKKALMDLNFAESRIITKACPQLQSYIEQNPSGEETGMLISVYLNEALEQLPKSYGHLYLSLNCSHFGYSIALWKKAIPDTTNQRIEVLDPNYIMGDILLNTKSRNKFHDTKISMQVISKVELLNLKSLMNVFRENGPEIVKALENYKIITDLF